MKVVIGRALAALVALVVSACVSAPPEPGRGHQPTGIEIPLPEPDFQAYIAVARERIAPLEDTLGRPLQPELVADRAPFQLEPAAGCPGLADGRVETGALLIHGLGETPFAVRDLGRALAEKCLLVRAILLPGHGTAPGDLLEVGIEEWVAATRAGVASFSGQARRLYLAGTSSGAALALRHALHEPFPEDVEPAGLILISPLLARRQAGGLLGRVGQFAAAGGRGGAWSELLPETDPVRYKSVPLRAEREVDRLIGELAQERPLPLPVFMALSADDEQVAAEAARRWFCRSLMGPRRLVWYSQGGEPVTDCRFVLARASAQQPDVLDIGHRGLAVAPDNPRHGRGAPVVACAHYFAEVDSPKWILCQDPAWVPANGELRYGAASPESARSWVLRRLTWNPDFTALVEELHRFLDETEQASFRAWVPIPAARP
jgi:esterase/lipase